MERIPNVRCGYSGRRGHDRCDSGVRRERGRGRHGSAKLGGATTFTVAVNAPTPDESDTTMSAFAAGLRIDLPAWGNLSIVFPEAGAAVELSNACSHWYYICDCDSYDQAANGLGEPPPDASGFESDDGSPDAVVNKEYTLSRPVAAVRRRPRRTLAARVRPGRRPLRPVAPTVR